MNTLNVNIKYPTSKEEINRVTSKECVKKETKEIKEAIKYLLENNYDFVDCHSEAKELTMLLEKLSKDDTLTLSKCVLIFNDYNGLAKRAAAESMVDILNEIVKGDEDSEDNSR